MRVLASVLALPFMVVVVVPSLIVMFLGEVDTRWPFSVPIYVTSRGVGFLLIGAGLALLVKTIRLFATVGKGTLAPWDPTQKLVVEGPYRHVRNPMITGVVTILLGEAVFWGSLAIAELAVVFFIINYVYFIVSEEPGLVRRFGEDYKTYMQHVPRWIPRTTPWDGP
ncbi:MAG: isoprenylcysteine carboxylmethyltransferase family protein [Vicinamibacteria bacterium]